MCVGMVDAAGRGGDVMAELPNPVMLWRNIATVARCKVLDALMAVERYVSERYRRPGPRDN
jgi:hypothetical protein